LAKKLTWEIAMSHEEQKHADELTDTGKEVVNEVAAPGEELLEAEKELNAAGMTESAEALLLVEKEKYMRLYSDFDNFKKRTARERMDIFTMAGKDVLLSMLPVLDDLERALKATTKLEGDAKAAFEGFELIYKKMNTTLESQGLKAMNCVGTPFDVELHEAITKIPAPTNALKGKVVDELEKGYLMNDKVIRFAKVIIGE